MRGVVMQLPSNPKKPKYGNKRTAYGGRTYASKAEAQRAAELDMLKRAGEIVSWRPQPRYTLGCDENVYIADFEIQWTNTYVTTEDVKGVETAKFKRDKKLWRRYANHRLVILKRVGGTWQKQIVEPQGEVSDAT